jgi:APA family basic amino acid/polyamine antiporter
MAQARKLSLNEALLININIMLGVGIFVSAIQLGVHAGPLGPFLYSAMGIIMLPLILGIALLMKKTSGGSFYDFGAQKIHPSLGFLSAWSYFIGKLASGSLMIHFAVKQFQFLFPALQSINILFIDYIILALFIGLNFLGLKIGSNIQKTFIALKFIPIVFIIAIGCYYFNPHHFTMVPYPWVGALTSIPIVLYAFMGFEASCSLSRNIENSEKNGPKAILFAFMIVMATTTLFQLAYYGAVSLNLLIPSSDPFRVIATFFGSTITTGFIQTPLLILMQSAIACSALGGAYGIIYSVPWNLYVLAQERHVFFSAQFTKLNRWNIPWLCIIAAAIVCGGYVWYIATTGLPAPLQQLSVLGCMISYSISIAALLFHNIQHEQYRLNKPWLVAIGATASCFLLTIFTLKSLYLTSKTPLIIFISILFVGLIMFFINRNNKKHL